MKAWKKLGLTEDEFYDMEFEEEGVVSIWIGLIFNKEDMGKDILQEQCGVGFYDIDFNEVFDFGEKIIPVKELISRLSYSSSFIEEVLKKLNQIGIKEARYVVAQYNFLFVPERANKKIISKSKDPIFIGAFPFKDS